MAHPEETAGSDASVSESDDSSLGSDRESLGRAQSPSEASTRPEHGNETVSPVKDDATDYAAHSAAQEQDPAALDPHYQQHQQHLQYQHQQHSQHQQYQQYPQHQQQYYQQQQQYYQQYQQYYQYYQQYHQSHSPQNNHDTPTATLPTQPVDLYYAHFAEQDPHLPPSASHDASRAGRQMQHYFDPTKFHTALSPEMQAAQQWDKQRQQARLTSKEIEAFKKRKEEKKKMRNKWLYE